MTRLTKYILFAPLVAAASLYLMAVATLYLYQRAIIYQPPQFVIGAPPDGSIYRTLPVEVPTGGRVMVWTALAAKAENPTVIFFHGNASHIRDFAAMGEVLHERGWGIVLAAYRGYSGNTGEPSEDGLIEDAHAILEAANPTGPVILWGHSLGSGIAARLASEQRATALILESPYTSLPDVAAEHYPIFPVHWLLTDRFDTATLVPNINVPVLIFHGTDDPVVPVTFGRRLAALFGSQATFVPLDNVGHAPHRRDLSNVVANWLSEIGIGTQL